MAAILGALIIAWITLYDTFGLGGATLAAVSAMFLLGIIRWRDVQRGVAFDVVGLYAAASAIAVGLSVTGGSLWLERGRWRVAPVPKRGNGAGDGSEHRDRHPDKFHE